MNLILEQKNLITTLYDPESITYTFGKGLEVSKGESIYKTLGLMVPNIKCEADTSLSLYENVKPLVNLKTNIPVEIIAHRRAGKTSCINQLCDELGGSNLCITKHLSSLRCLKNKANKTYLIYDTQIRKWDHIFVDEFQEFSQFELNMISKYSHGAKLFFFGTQRYESKLCINLTYPFSTNHFDYDKIKNLLSEKDFNTEYLLK